MDGQQQETPSRPTGSPEATDGADASTIFRSEVEQLQLEENAEEEAATAVTGDEPTPAGSSGAASNDEAPLPMVVWLRGDEEVCSEFILDAEEVMQKLGIRRSRLTQISGRELRVGRLRRGRYVSPVYRQADVEAYQSWTRASASHLKSSGLLQEASEELLQQSERLADRLASVPESLAQQVRAHVEAAREALHTDFMRHAAQLNHRMQALGEAQQRAEERLAAALASPEPLLARLAAEIEAQHLQLQALTIQLTEVAGLSRVHRQELEQRQQDAHRSYEQLREQTLGSLQQLRQESARNYADLREALTPATPGPALKRRPSLASARRLQKHLPVPPGPVPPRARPQPRAGARRRPI